MPINAITRQPYQGKNAAVLAFASAAYNCSEWLTFRQALSIGRCVKKGEHGIGILKVIEDKQDRKKKGIRGYTVFNLEQTAPLAPKA